MWSFSITQELQIISFLEATAGLKTAKSGSLRLAAQAEKDLQGADKIRGDSLLALSANTKNQTAKPSMSRISTKSWMPKH